MGHFSPLYRIRVNVHLVVNSLLVVYLLRLSEGALKPLLTYLLIREASVDLLLSGPLTRCDGVWIDRRSMPQRRPMIDNTTFD